MVEDINTSRCMNDYHGFFPEICRTCLLVANINLGAFYINFINSNKLEITLHDKLSFCCPELDLRINSKAMVCVNCCDIIRMMYKFTYKFDQNRTQFQENFSLAFRTVQNYHLFKNNCIGKYEIKSEEVDLYDTEKDSLSKHMQIQIKHFQSNSKSGMSIPTREKSFQCSQCNYRCVQKRDLRRHVRIHTGEKPFKCSVCNYSSTTKCTLKRHLYIHNQQKPFKCSMCNYSSATNSDLKIHFRIHTGEKPFKCSLCDYSCIQKKNLKRHSYMHTGEKPLKCSQCYYCCINKNELKIHLQCHTGEKPLKCSVCDYTSNRKSSVNRHSQIHTKQKLFKCSQCDYTCKQKEHLKRHLHVHTEKKLLK